jgi:hypothetical protein
MTFLEAIDCATVEFDLISSINGVLNSTKLLVLVGPRDIRYDDSCKSRQGIQEYKNRI